MAKRPSFQFYPGDWMKDPALGQCRAATRGIWMDLLCAIHETDDGGTVSGTIESLTQLCRCQPAEMETALEEIVQLKAGHVTRNGEIVTVESRRMARESGERKSWRDRKTRQRSRNVPPKSRQSPRVSSSSSSSSSSDKTPKPPTPQPPESLNTPEFAEALEAWKKYRSETNKKLTPTGLSRQFKKMEKIGVVRAIAMIDNSITQGYQGLFESKDRQSSNGSDPTDAADSYARNNKIGKYAP